MHIPMRCLGLEHLLEHDSSSRGLIKDILNRGRQVPGYSSGPCVNLNLGGPEFMASTRKDPETGKLQLLAVTAHCRGTAVFELQMGFDLSPAHWDFSRRRLALCRYGSEVASLVADVVNAQVLPSLVPGDALTLQMLAFPIHPELYESMGALRQAGRNQNLPDKGVLYPLGLMDHHPRPGEPALKEEDRQPEEVMFLAGTIKELKPGKTILPDREYTTFIDCLLETPLGDLQAAFSLGQIPHRMRHLLRPGSVLAGTCLLSADAAILEYRDGPVKDLPHHLALLRHTFLLGQAERMSSMLAPGAVYVSATMGREFHGADAIIARLNQVAALKQGSYFVYPATLLETSSQAVPPGGWFPPDTPCLVLALGGPERYHSIALLDLDEQGFIRRILVSGPEGYRVALSGWPEAGKPGA